MPTARTKAGPGDARVLDFKKAYAQVHGKEPEVPEQPSSIRVPSPPRGMFRDRQIKEQLDALAAPTGHKGKRVIAELDLECDGGKRGIFKTIVPGDSVMVRAARSFAEIVFTGINERGLLVCMRFKNGEVPYPHEIDFSEFERPAKVWEGTLMNGTYFKVEVARLPIYSFEGGVVANVDISVIIERNPLTSHLDF